MVKKSLKIAKLCFAIALLAGCSKTPDEMCNEAANHVVEVIALSSAPANIDSRVLDQKIRIAKEKVLASAVAQCKPRVNRARYGCTMKAQTEEEIRRCGLVVN